MKTKLIGTLCALLLSASVTQAEKPAIITGAGPGGGPHVIGRLYDTALTSPFASFFAYNQAFRGGVEVAACDLDGDNIDELITGAGPGGGPHVIAFKGADLKQGRYVILHSFFAFASTFTGGVHVACGDFNGDRRGDIVVGAGRGGSPHVRVVSGVDLRELASFFAYETGFTGGVNVAIGDFNGDGRNDLITGAGPGGGPRVRVFNGQNLGNSLADFLAYDAGFRGGVDVAIGDVNRDGRGDIVTGALAGGGPHVKVFANGSTGLTALYSFFAYAQAFRGGVNVAAFDFDGDGSADIMTGAGPGGGPHVKIFNGQSITQVMKDFMAYDPAFRGGVYVTGLSLSLPQCQDNIDNDGDGAKDYPQDFSCLGVTDNDEANQKSQCQNAIDDDGDGLIDSQDPGCSNNQDNNEGDGTTQCQDQIDNDQDGSIDFPTDFGCTNAQDNNEGDEPAIFTVGVECITKNVDNTTTAYFSYNNTSGSNLSFTSDQAAGTVNRFVSSTSSIQPPTQFKPGLAKGGVVVTFTGDSLSWSVRAPRSALSQATASSSSPVCASLTPQAECRGFKSGKLVARLGYNNPSSVQQQLPIGGLNFFSPGKSDRGQPNQFLAGSNKSVFELELASETDSVTWNLNGKSVVINKSLPLCDGLCLDNPTGAVTGNLNKVASDLSKIMTQAAQSLSAAKATSAGSRTAKNKKDGERARKKAAAYEKTAKEIIIGIPAVIKTCPEAPAFCQTIDRQSSIESLKGLYANQVNSIKRTIARAYFRNTGMTSRMDNLVKQAKALEQQGLAELAKLPRFETQCK